MDCNKKVSFVLLSNCWKQLCFDIELEFKWLEVNLDLRRLNIILVLGMKKIIIKYF